MKKYLLLLAGCLPILVFAQSADKQPENKEAERIIVTRKGNEDKKLTIVVEGDRITVNGKPATDDADADIQVRRMKIKDLDNFSGWQDADGPVQQNWQGIHRSANKAMLGVLSGPDEKGAKITQVTPGSAAEKAGLKTGDIITKVAGKPIESPSELSAAFKDSQPGDQVEITYLREGKTQTTTATLTEWSSADQFNFRDNGAGFPNNSFNFRDLFGQPSPGMQGNEGIWRYRFGQPGSQSREEGPKLGIRVQDNANGNGVNILAVTTGSDADRAGLKQGDQILKIAGESVSSTEALQSELSKARPGSTLVLSIRRNGKDREITVELSRKLNTADL